MRRSTSTRKLTPKLSAMVCASIMIAFDSARVAGSVQITSSVAWVRALIGLRQTLPHSLSQISSRMRSSTGACMPAVTNISESRCTSEVCLARGLAEREAVAIDVTDHAGRLDLGRGIDDAADRALRRQFAPLPAAGIDALQRRSLMGAAMPVEIPVGNAVDRGDDAGVRSEQRLHLLEHAGDGMRLQADDDVILRPEFGGIVGAARMHHALFVADQELEPVGAHRGEMGAARHQADIDARARKLHTEIAADRAGAVDADFHGVFRKSQWVTIPASEQAPAQKIVSDRRVAAEVRETNVRPKWPAGRWLPRQTRSRCRGC